MIGRKTILDDNIVKGHLYRKRV